jgi:TonB family protein
MFEALSGRSQQRSPRRPIAILTALGLHAAVIGAFLVVASTKTEAIVEPDVRITRCWAQRAIKVELGKHGPKKSQAPAPSPNPDSHRRKSHMTQPRTMMAAPIPDPIQPEPETLPSQPASTNASPTNILGEGNQAGDTSNPSGENDGVACPAGAVCSNIGGEQVLSFSIALSRPHARCNPPAPSAPYSARQMGLAGRVVAQYVIHVDGRADSLRVLNSDAPPMFTQAVREWLEQCSFEPAQLNGAPYSVRMTQVFRFETK